MGQVVLWLLIKTILCKFRSITQEPLGLLTICFNTFIISKSGVDNFKIPLKHKTCSLLVGAKFHFKSYSFLAETLTEKFWIKNK